MTGKLFPDPRGVAREKVEIFYVFLVRGNAKIGKTYLRQHINTVTKSKLRVLQLCPGPVFAGFCRCHFGGDLTLVLTSL